MINHHFGYITKSLKETQLHSHFTLKNLSLITPKAGGEKTTQTNKP
jgi:hypothetical protein